MWQRWIPGVLLLLLAGCDTAGPAKAGGDAARGGDAAPGGDAARGGDAAAGGDAAGTDAATDPLLAQLSDSTGCTVRCDGPPPGPSCIVYCPPKSGQLGWEWDPPRCEDPHYISDYEPSEDMSCWAPPASWCADGAGWAITEACTPDGAACCSFASTCIPCGWVSCREQGAPAFCEPLVREDVPPGAFDSCPAGQHQMFECIVCGTALVCTEE